MRVRASQRSRSAMALASAALAASTGSAAAPIQRASVPIDTYQVVKIYAHDRHAFTHGKPHLRGSVMLNEHLLRDDMTNPLIADKGKLAKLSASQLMLLFTAAELHRRWDPHDRSYSTELQADIGAGELGEVVLNALAAKSARWAQALPLVRKHIDELVDRLVVKLNDTNAGEGEPAPKARKK